MQAHKTELNNPPTSKVNKTNKQTNPNQIVSSQQPNPNKRPAPTITQQATQTLKYKIKLQSKYHNPTRNKQPTQHNENNNTSHQSPHKPPNKQHNTHRKTKYNQTIKQTKINRKTKHPTITKQVNKPFNKTQPTNQTTHKPKLQIKYQSTVNYPPQPTNTTPTLQPNTNNKTSIQRIKIESPNSHKTKSQTTSSNP